VQVLVPVLDADFPMSDLESSWLQIATSSEGKGSDRATLHLSIPVVARDETSRSMSPSLSYGRDISSLFDFVHILISRVAFFR